MDETFRYIYVEIIEKYTLDYIKAFEFEYTPWVFSLLGSICIGLSGIFPLLVIPADAVGSGQYNDRKYWFSLCTISVFSLCIYIENT